MAETPEQKYNRIAAAVRQTILTEFPNPDRVGCPGDAKLREVASRRKIVEDNDWQHITHCSPCYAEYLAIKEHNRRAGRRARTLGLIGGSAVLVALTGLTGYEYVETQKASQQNASNVFEAATLDLRESSGPRGDQSAPQRDVPVLPARHLNLKIILPFGSEPGKYRIEFMDKTGRVFADSDASAKIAAGETALITRVDLSNKNPGDYTIGLRQQSYDSIRHQFQIR